MRILGADLREVDLAGIGAAIVALDAGGAAAGIARAADLAGLAREVARLAAGEPFLLAVDVSVASGGGPKPRRVDGWVRRRLGVRLPATSPVGGAELLHALAIAGLPCLPFPDRDRRQSGLVEAHPELSIKSLLWERSVAANAHDLPEREAVLRALAPPEYRGARALLRGWHARYAALDAAVTTVSQVAGFDVRPVSDELLRAGSDAALSLASAHFDALLLAGTARRYLEEPERCAFVGLRESGYVVLPADAFVRRVALREGPAASGAETLFPRASLESRLAPHATVRPSALLDMPGHAQQVEAVYNAQPRYEFDNLDEMLWWKHCRHLAGPELIADGLNEIVVRLEGDDESKSLRLVRSRHKTLSFRFEPPSAWRLRIATRDGRTYPFRVLRATFDR